MQTYEPYQSASMGLVEVFSAGFQYFALMPESPTMECEYFTPYLPLQRHAHYPSRQLL